MSALSGVLTAPLGLRLPRGLRTPKAARNRVARRPRRVVRAWRVARMLLEVGLSLVRALVRSRGDGAAPSRFAARSAKRTLAALNVRLRVRGAPPVTTGAVLVVANHVSWLDVYALNAVAPARFLAKREVRGWPIVGLIAARTGTIFIVRGSFRDAARVKDRVASELAAGRRVVVFPEGTTTDGTSVERFYAAMLQAAVDAGAAVQPVAIRYTDAAGRLQPAAAFVGDMTFVESLRRVLREPLIDAELTFGAPIAAARSRRELARATREWIVRALGLRGDGLGAQPNVRDRPPRRAA